jgi:ATP-grasp domain
VRECVAAFVTVSAKPLRVLLLFEKEWDAGGFKPLVQSGELQLFNEGFDLFRMPENVKLLTFDAWRFVDRMCAKYRGRIDGVLSGDEQFGALLAAIIAERLGLAGNDAASIARAQHKYLLRQIQQKVAPEAAVAAAPLPFTLTERRARDPQVIASGFKSIGRTFPAFVKPIKATFSVLARHVATAEELAQHVTFGTLERLIIGRLVRPYANLASRLIEMPCDPARLLVEEAIEGHQINVDGYAHKGDIRFLGFVDEWMYPNAAGGAKHFLRFDYPSKISPSLGSHVKELVERVLRATGFRHGFFNCELFVQTDGGVKFIEINPRLAVQFVAMYRDVEGIDVYRMMAALARGTDPAAEPRLPKIAGAAASFVFRRFDGATAPQPKAGAQEWLAERHPSAELTMYHKRGNDLAREYKWLGSHRYALLNMSGRDEATLHYDYAEACARLGWPCELDLNAGIFPSF